MIPPRNTKWGIIGGINQKLNKTIVFKLYATCVQLKLTARDGKKYQTDVLNENQLNFLLAIMAKADKENLVNWIKGLDKSLDEKSKQKAYELYDNGFLDFR